MSNMIIAKAVIRELLMPRTAKRIPEPDLIMDDPDKVRAYTRAGREDGVMQALYLFNCQQICSIIKPGDVVVDLGCGPATQLGLVARLNPDIQFIGVDLSEEMLNKASAYLAELNIDNVELRQQDITQLQSFDNNSVDAVMSTVVLHHLPDTQCLENTFAQVKRILKPDAGLYLADFGHLKSDKTIQNFAYQYADQQAELFTLDYLYSLQAAFWPEDFERLYSQHLQSFATFYKTIIFPFMMIIKSPNRREINSHLQEQFNTLYQAMPDNNMKDFNNLARFFQLSGLK